MVVRVLGMVERGVDRERVRGAVRVAVGLVHRVHARTEGRVAWHAVEADLRSRGSAAREAHLRLLGLLRALAGEARCDVLERDVVVVAAHGALRELVETAHVARSDGGGVVIVLSIHAIIILVLPTAHHQLVCPALLFAHLAHAGCIPPALAVLRTVLGAHGDERDELLRARRLFDAGEARAVAPFVVLATEGVRFLAEETELAGRHDALTAVGVDKRDARVDDRGLGRPADGREVGKECG